MKRTHTRAIVTDLIIEILADTPDLTCANVLRAVQSLRPCSRAHVRRVLDELEGSGAITCNRSALRPFLFRIKEDDGLPVVVRGEETPKFDGPVLSPMEWSMRHLLGAV